jgi:hypothetical protein
MEKVHRDKKEYASKAVGGTALGLSIGALGLQLLGGGLLNGGLFGNRATVAETAAIAGTAANEHYLERKQCADQVQFVNDMWRSTYAQQNQRFEDRQTINQEMFGIYSAMRNGFDVINATANKNAFDLYKYSRDSKDELAGQIGELKTELAVLKATRPYQDDVYNNVSAELQMLIQQELINSVRDKVANSPRGKELLEKQLNNIRAKKDSIIEEANKELELFKKFQIAVQANPKLTYIDFCNNIKNKEV